MLGGIFKAKNPQTRGYGIELSASGVAGRSSEVGLINFTAPGDSNKGQGNGCRAYLEYEWVR